MRMLGLAGAAALLIATCGEPAAAGDLKSVVRTLNAIINPEDAWRLEDQARRYHQQEEARYWHGYADGLTRQRREHREPVPEYRGWGGYGGPVDPDEAYRLEHQAGRFGHPGAEAYWRRYGEGLRR
jgi:hypothetical protein